MNLVTMILFAVFIIPIALGIAFLRRSRKIARIFLSIPFIFIIGVAAWWFYETNHHFVSNTDLVDERIGSFSLQEDVTEEFLDELGIYEEVEDANFDQLFDFGDIEIGTSIHDKIIHIKTSSEEYQTEKGIKVGDSTDTIIASYGEKYYKQQTALADRTINYVDRDAKIHLQFFIEKDRIIEIALKAL